MNNITITLDGVLHSLQNLKSHKECRPDEIPIHLLKEIAEVCSTYSVTVFWSLIETRRNSKRVEA